MPDAAEAFDSLNRDLDNADSPGVHDQMKTYRESTRYYREFTRKWGGFWFAVMPIVVIAPMIQGAVKSGSWFVPIFMSPFIVMLFIICWQMRRLMLKFLELQNREDDAREISIIEAGERAQRRRERRKRAEDRLAKINYQREQKAEADRAADLQALARELSDSDTPDADT